MTQEPVIAIMSGPMSAAGVGQSWGVEARVLLMSRRSTELPARNGPLPRWPADVVSSRYGES